MSMKMMAFIIITSQVLPPQLHGLMPDPVHSVTIVINTSFLGNFWLEQEQDPTVVFNRKLFKLMPNLTYLCGVLCVSKFGS